MIHDDDITKIIEGRIFEVSTIPVDHQMNELKNITRALRQLGEVYTNSYTLPNNSIRFEFNISSLRDTATVVKILQESTLIFAPVNSG